MKGPPIKTDVLIIGGGLAGCATAYFLARAGAGVTVIERSDLNTRASGANAGSIHVQIPHPEFVALGEAWARQFAPTLALLRASVQLWTEIGAELGADLEVTLTGGLLVAETDAQLRTIERKVAIERAHGVEIDMITAADLRARAPYLSTRMIGGAFCAGEGRANPLLATPAFAAAARQAGAAILTRTELVGLEAAPGGYLARTSAGPITAGRVVDAAGADAGRIGAMLGVDLPIAGVPLQVSVTEPVAPLVGHLVYSAAGKLTLKQMANGCCLIGGGWPSIRRPDGRLAVDPGSLRDNLATAFAAVPALAHARVVRTWPALVNGTDDWRPIIGEVPGRPGFFINMFPWMGFTGGPIAARTTAELILGRRSEVDLERISALA